MKHIRRRKQNADKNNRLRKRAAPRTVEQYFAMPERSQDIWNRVAHVISKMRADGASLHEASRESQIDPRTVIRWSGSALRKTAKGRYAARASDRLLRVLLVPTPTGLNEVAIRDSRQASELAKYSDAVQKYLETGAASELHKFDGQYIIDADGQRVRLLTNLGELDRLGSAGVLSFESLYARTTT